ncbi:threonine-phosphate decarboxylase [Denitratisoma sp. DHT3]|uniref:threonine-phosphate decarboxylase CobD n=1 Tax=Denitratisoma sp. DHT3 TaxID=1981880 RepID=UPI0011986F68|nr:threonine-phosphate decarboxylase CobD [Denitratisoma sp. DHT3]QDX81749.1 threonine-phosphate decarboxylase [Denitratisoma sp. DHT3]
MLEHGGRLRAAARQYGIALSDWLDLSTGINPLGWPVPSMPAECWQRLPEPDDGLAEAACRCYEADSVLPVAGSQAAIQALPALRPPGRVGMARPAYAEHAQAWRRAGHAVVPWSAGDSLDSLDGLDVLLLVHPNNPTGTRYDVARLLQWRQRLAARGGWLVVDEAFMDATPAASLARYCALPGLIVLRSLGKFFGLAGARVGFVLAQDALVRRLDAALGPWTVAGPSRWLARHALADTAWQAQARIRLAAASARLAALLARHGLAPRGGTALFQWVRTPQASVIQQALAMRGILIRRFAEPASLRFGLPAGEAAWARLDAGLGAASKEATVRSRARFRISR